MPVLQAELLNQGFYGMPQQLRNLQLLIPVIRKVNVGTLVAVAANTTAEQVVPTTVPGLQVGDFVAITKPTAQAGLGIVGARVSAANTLAITYVNATAGALTPTAAEIYLVLHASAVAS